jgi:multiple sugar transport system substrate-binding protein
MKIKTVRMAKRMLGLTSAVAMAFCFTACGQKAEKSTEFKPTLSSETSCQIKVAGNYSNFESLESEFERFFEYYPNVSLNYVNLDDYNNTITSALMSDEAPDIYVTATWMLEDDKMAPVFENAEVLSDPSLNINLDCLRKGTCWTLENGDVVMLPIFTRTYGMLVNMDLFEMNGLEVPKNYNELVDVCDKLKAAGYEVPIM